MTRSHRRRYVYPATILVAALALLSPRGADAQTYSGCMSFVKNLKTTQSCVGDPFFDKYFEATKIHWSDGTPYLVINTGNDLELYNISNPKSPTQTTGTGFWYNGFNLGDSDYDLINYSLCDGCRYGISNYKLGTFLYDLGTAGSPAFSGTAQKYDPVLIGASTGFTFRHGGQQYVIGSDLTVGSCADGVPVYLMNGVAPGDLSQAGCVPLAGAPPGWTVLNGVELAGDQVGMADSTGNMRVFEVGGSGTSLTFTEAGPIILGGVGKNVGTSADRTQKLALLTKVGQPARLYSLSAVGAAPTLLNEHDANANLAALGGSLLFTSRAYYPGSQTLYSIDDFAGSATPVLLGGDFFSTAYTWNQNECEKPTGAVLSDDGSTLYTTDYSVVKVIDVTACGDPVAPTAGLAVTPANPFPGDNVTVSNASSGGTRSAIWVTATSDPAGAALFGTTATLSATTTPVTFTVPEALLATQHYWAHVAVETDDFPCDPVTNPVACGEQLATQEVFIDREPVVTAITYSPTAPLTGDRVTFTPAAEGTPSSWTWDIVSPSQVHSTDPVDVLLNESGIWSVTATAHYLIDDGTYSDSDTITLNISSVFATFTVPSSPLNTTAITLNGSDSRPAPSATISYTWLVTGPVTYSGCGSVAQCVIPADTLDPGDYQVTLTLHNSTDGKDSVAGPTPLHVADGSINLGFTVAPTSPDIGQFVGFAITGVPGAIDQATWNFGGPGCTQSQSYTCTPGMTDCKQASYKYSTPGVKTVTLWVTVGGVQFGPATNTVNVQSTGSCTPTSPTPTPAPTPRVGDCTYTVSPTTTSVPFWGGQGSVYVDVTGTGCSWSADSNNPGWLNGVSPTSGTVSAPVTFSATSNPWGARTGTLVVAGKTVTVNQPAFVATTFDISDAQPDRGQTVTFTVPAALEPVSWNFGNRNCQGDVQTVNCGLMPDACRTYQWTYPKGGLFDVTLTTKSGSATRTVWVQPNGECCTADIPPDASFTVSPNPPMAGEAVTFTHVGRTACETTVYPLAASLPATGGSASFNVTTGTDCPWSATSSQSWITVTSSSSGNGPAQVSYTVQVNTGPARSGTIVVNDAAHTVHQDAGNCTVTLDPASASFAAGGGSGTVTVTADAGCSWTAVPDSSWISVTTPPAGAGAGSGTVTYQVATNTGAARTGAVTVNGATHAVSQDASSDIGLPGSKALAVDFSWSPTSPEIAQLTSFHISGYGGAVRAEWNFGGPGCGGVTQTPVCNPSFTNCLDYTYKFGTAGTHTVSVTVKDPSSGGVIGTATHQVVVQNVGSCGGVVTPTPTPSPTPTPTPSPTPTPTPTGDDTANQWQWTITRNGGTVATSADESFQHVFSEPGSYHVQLVAGNCQGTRSKGLDFEVEPSPAQAAENYLVPAAVHTAGLNDTLWRTDLKLFNPCTTPVTLTVEYLPENQNNSTLVVPKITYDLPGKGTKIVDDIVQHFSGDTLKGSLRFSYDGAEGCTPLIISRTYNDTAFGTFGQFVPAVPVLPVGSAPLYLTGLVSDYYYRTNIGLANFGAEDAWVTITLYDQDGNQIGDQRTVKVYGDSTRQVVGVAQELGVLTDVNIFSAAIDAHGADMSVYASVVDNQTGDSVLYQPFATGDAEVWVPGIAHLAGLNGSEWRSDISFFNPTAGPISTDVTYVPSEDLGFTPGMEMDINPGAAAYFVDVLGEGNLLPEGTDSKGYFVVSSLDGSPLPEIAARTYDLAPDGGTFGQTLKTFSSMDMVSADQSAYLPGVTNTDSDVTGFRTNLGLLSPTASTQVQITLYDLDGRVAADPVTLWVLPGKLQQFDLFKKLGLAAVDIDGSVEVKVLQGGPMGVYASVVDNRTQDPVLIPAIRRLTPSP